MVDFAPPPNVISQITPIVLGVKPLETLENHCTVQLGHPTSLFKMVSLASKICRRIQNAASVHMW